MLHNYLSQLFSIRFKFLICLLSRARATLKLSFLSTRYPCIELRTKTDVIVYISYYLLCFMSYKRFVVLMGMSSETKGGEGEVASSLAEILPGFLIHT